MNWEPHLEAGERLLWSGRPRGGFFSGDSTTKLSSVFLCLYVPGATLAVIDMALQGDTTSARVFGIGFSFVSLWFGWFLWLDRRDRKTAHYAVTNQRVLVGRHGTTENISWFVRDEREIYSAWSRNIFFGGRESIPNLYLPGSFPHRVLSFDLFFHLHHRGKQTWVVLRDLDDVDGVLDKIESKGTRNY